MCHRWELMVSLDVLNNIKGSIPIATAGPVGAGKKVWFQKSEFRDRLEQILISDVGLWWKKFKRIGAIILFKKIRDLFHGKNYNTMTVAGPTTFILFDEMFLILRFYIKMEKS